MLDLKYIAKNLEEVKKGLAKKRFKFDIDGLLRTDEKRRQLIVEIESLKALQNKASKEISQVKGKERETKIAEMQAVVTKLKKLEPELKALQEEIDKKLLLLPNPAHESVPEGASEEKNLVVKKHGKPRQFSFKPRDHVEIGKILDVIDIERAVKVSGTRFAYLKNELAQMEFALVSFALNKLISKGFVPVIPPVLVKEEAMYGTGFFPTDEAQVYKITEDKLFLVGTSEVSLAAMHIDEILDGSKLPLRYTGFSTCFRREAGTYGKDTRGLFRVHQFDKVEMFSFCQPEKSWEEHEFLLSIEEELMRELGFSYQVVNICGGELGAPAAKKYDIEVWLPSEGRYRELTSCSNCTDFQARRLNCRTKTEKGNIVVHTLNGTAVAIGRTLIAILENYQQSDGSLIVPEVLRPYLNGLECIPVKG